MSPTPFTAERFAGRTAIVTGAGSGIGRATAIRLALEGATVIATDISEARLAELVAEHPELGFVTVAGDVSSQELVDRVVATAGGRVDALANIAGIMDAFLPPAEVDDATWDRVFAVNVTAVMRMTRAVLPLMIEAGSGSIVNVSSEASLRASASGAAYTASKHAVNGFTKSTAVFYKPKGIRANGISAGPIKTLAASGIKGFSKILSVVEQNAPLRRNVTIEDVGNVAAFMLSDLAGGVTAEITYVDGGFSHVMGGLGDLAE